MAGAGQGHTGAVTHAVAITGSPERGAAAICAASGLRRVEGGPWGVLGTLGQSHPMATLGRLGAGICGTPKSAWYPNWHPKRGCWGVPPTPGRDRAEEGARPAARRGGGTKLAPREAAKFSPEPRLRAPAGRGATISAVHLSSIPLSPPPQAPPGPHSPPLPAMEQGQTPLG